MALSITSTSFAAAMVHLHWEMYLYLTDKERSFEKLSVFIGEAPRKKIFFWIKSRIKRFFWAGWRGIKSIQYKCVNITHCG